MKKLIIPLFLLLMISCTSTIIFEGEAGHLTVTIDSAGKIVSLKDTEKGVEYMAEQPSCLIRCSRYGNRDQLEIPISASCVDGNKVVLTYPGQVQLTVAIEPKDNYFRMELVKADPVSEVSEIQWGPYYTTAQSFIGEWLGIVRSDDLSIGLMSLEPNTDGICSCYPVAKYTEEGALLQLFSFDHTRGLFRDFGADGIEQQLRHSAPLEVTVEGSAVALYASRPGYDNELDAIENVVLNERLPYPTIDGVWNKRSRKQTKFCLWSHYNENNYKDYLSLARETGAGILCLPHGYSENWGHFDIDLKKYPGGLPGLLKISREAQQLGIGTTLYSLTTFTKPLSAREPYLGPIPDDRLQTWRYTSDVVRTVQAGDPVIVIRNTPEVLETVKLTRHIRIDNELITYTDYQEEKENIILSGCDRGTFSTVDTVHQPGTKVKFMYFAGFNNYYPATIDMIIEESDRLFHIMKETDQKMFVTDGFESCMEAGYGCYAGNRFADNFYKKGKAHHMEYAWTGSNFSNYTWHHSSHMSWGEGDQDKGIRGSMLDYRISRQVLLSTSLMPKKLGQFYPDRATVADIEWLMAFSTGWDSGCDFSVDLHSFQRNPHYKEIIQKMALWSKAREEKAFTNDQLRELRQADREYTLSCNEEGTWQLEFVRRWMSDRVKVRPSEDFPVKSLSGSPVRPCSIDWSWTHNPATYYEVILTNDMLHDTGNRASEWEVSYPRFVNPKGSWYQTDARHFLFVLRVPETSPCAVKDVVITYNGYRIQLPVTLQPGEYLTMPQLVPIVCVYNARHELLEEKMIRGELPFVQTGESARITMSCTAEDPSETPSMIMNVRCQNGYYFPKPIK